MLFRSDSKPTGQTASPITVLPSDAYFGGPTDAADTPTTAPEFELTSDESPIDALSASQFGVEALPSAPDPTRVRPARLSMDLVSAAPSGILHSLEEENVGSTEPFQQPASRLGDEAVPTICECLEMPTERVSLDMDRPAVVCGAVRRPANATEEPEIPPAAPPQPNGPNRRPRCRRCGIYVGPDSGEASQRCPYCERL